MADCLHLLLVVNVLTTRGSDEAEDDKVGDSACLNILRFGSQISDSSSWTLAAMEDIQHMLHTKKTMEIPQTSPSQALFQMFSRLPTP